MNLLPEHRAFVKGQLDFHERQIVKWAHDSRRQKRHIDTAEQFRSLYDYLVGLEEWCASAPPRLSPRASSTSVSWEEAQELPEELRAELNLTDTDKAEFEILTIIEAQGGTASLDRILVEYFRATGEVMKRQLMVNRLYRMASKELIYSVSGKKGVYAIQRDEDGIQQLIG
jgi:hypothetical protein